MKEEHRDFAAQFAGAVVEQDFQKAHKLLAPWLQSDLSPADLQAAFEKELWATNEHWEIKELIFPAGFEIDGNSCGLAELKIEYDWCEPRKISGEISDENF